MAETYRIYDYRGVPVRLLGTLVSGLGDKSRIGQKVAGVTAPADTILLAKIYDMINILIWMQTEDGMKGRNKPKELAPNFYIETKNNETFGFENGAEYEKARAKLIEELEG